MTVAFANLHKPVSLKARSNTHTPELIAQFVTKYSRYRAGRLRAVYATSRNTHIEQLRDARFCRIRDVAFGYCPPAPGT
jgi:hypothetical protein